MKWQVLRGWLAAAIALASLSACAQSATEDLLLSLKIKHGPVTPKDFVVNSRASAPRHDFMPVGVTPPDHAIRIKSKDEVLAATAALDGLRGRHDRAAERKPRAARKTARPAPPPPAAPNNAY